MERLRASIARWARPSRSGSGEAFCTTEPSATLAPTECSWDALREVYEEQAARGVPEAVRGLELIQQDRWPTSGRPRWPG